MEFLIFSPYALYEYKSTFFFLQKMQLISLHEMVKISLYCFLDAQLK